ncbi:MAG: hypothetical protein GY711_32240 [bacterium]|nr:hypothetical protein [bacterium]
MKHTIPFSLLLLAALATHARAQDTSPPRRSDLQPAWAAPVVQAPWAPPVEAQAPAAPVERANHSVSPWPGRPDTLQSTAPVVDRDRVHYSESADGALWARGADYKAGFDPGGVTFVPFFGSHVPRNYPIHFRLVAVTAGDAPLQLAPAAVSREADAVTLDHGALLERYHLAPASIEQTFVLDRFPGVGEVVVEIEVATDLATEAGPQGLRFDSDHGSVGYTNAVAFDATGSELALDTRWSDGSIEIRLPAALLAAADYPLTIDPIVSVFPIDGYVADLQDPDVAYDMTNDVYLVVYREVFSGSDGDIYSSLIDGSGAHVEGKYFDSTTFDYGDVAVASNNWTDKFLVAVEFRGTHERVDVFTYEADTHAVWGPYPMEVGYPGDLSNPDVGGEVFDGESYFLIVYERGVSASDHDIHGVLFDPATQAIVGQPFSIDSTSAHDTRPAVSKTAGSSAGFAYAVVWERAVTPTNHNIWGAEIEWSGAILTAPWEIADAPDDETVPDVSSHIDYSGQRIFCVAYAAQMPGDNDIVLRPFRGSTALDYMNLSAEEGANVFANQYGPAIDSDGTGFAVAYAEGPVATRSVYVASVGFEGALCIAEGHQGFAPTHNDWDPKATSTASGGGATGRFAFVWRHENATDSDIEGGLYDAIPCGGGPLGTSYCSPANNNSSGLPGVMSAFGDAAAGGNLTLTATQLPPWQFGYFLASQNQGFFQPGGSMGILCLATPIARFNVQVQSSGEFGTFSIAVDTQNIPFSPAVPITSGQTWNFQAWFRDVNNSNNFSDAIPITFL